MYFGRIGCFEIGFKESVNQTEGIGRRNREIYCHHKKNYEVIAGKAIYTPRKWKTLW
jgi:hypothetical protein